MQLRGWIESDYHEAVSILPEIEGELRRALKSSERAPVFLRNMELEIRKIWMKRRLNRNEIKTLVYDMTKFFCMNLKRMKDEAYMSDLAKSAERARAEQFKQLDRTSDGKVTGDFAEIVKEVTDGRDKAQDGASKQANGN